MAGHSRLGDDQAAHGGVFEKRTRRFHVHTNVRQFVSSGLNGAMIVRSQLEVLFSHRTRNAQKYSSHSGFRGAETTHEDAPRCKRRASDDDCAVCLRPLGGCLIVDLLAFGLRVRR